MTSRALISPRRRGGLSESSSSSMGLTVQFSRRQVMGAGSPVSILGALPCKCLLLRLGDPRQTSGGTGPGRLAQEARAVSDELSLATRSARQPLLPQELPHLVQTLLIDDLPPRSEPLPHRPGRRACPLVVPLRPRQSARQCRSFRHPTCPDACRHRCWPPLAPDQRH